LSDKIFNPLLSLSGTRGFFNCHTNLLKGESKVSSNLEVKKELVSEIKDKVSRAKSIAFVNYSGTSVAENTALRSRFKTIGAEFKVYKNRLVLRALNELGLTGADELLQGTNAMAFGYEDEVMPAKILAEVGKGKKFNVVFGILGDKVVEAGDIKTLATLPSKEVLIAKLLGNILAPATGLVSVLSAPARGLAVALNGISEKK
jgi:large subunit ribosomal protein L10